MAIVAGVQPVSQSVLAWLGKLGIETKGVRRVSVTFDVGDVVTIDIQKFMRADEVGPFQELIDELTPEKMLVGEKYQIEPIAPEPSDGEKCLSCGEVKGQAGRLFEEFLETADEVSRLRDSQSSQ